jgi:hypothetical protein
MRPGAKQIILDALGLKKYTSTDINLKKLNDFFRKKVKPFRQDLENLYKKIDEAVFKKSQYDIGIRSFLYRLYNDCSQYVHSGVSDNSHANTLYIYHLSILMDYLIGVAQEKLKNNLTSKSLMSEVDRKLKIS